LLLIEVKTQGSGLVHTKFESRYSGIAGGAVAVAGQWPWLDYTSSELEAVGKTSRWQFGTMCRRMQKGEWAGAIRCMSTNNCHFGGEILLQ
jgi:hypothetical protein